jgi:hypothetical protein
MRMSICSSAVLLVCAVVAAASRPAKAQTDSARTTTTAKDTTRRSALDTVKVLGRIDDLRGVATTASEGRIGAADLHLRPIAREGELLETVPGMIVTQHSGDGKANQYFVRGFNLDHGTDFQTRLEGMPLNLPTHGHGQGYTDLNFLIPEFVDYVDYKLGVYHPEVGDFGSAGGAAFHLMSKLERPFATAAYGQNGLGRLAYGNSFRVGKGDLLIGAEGKVYDGPWQVPERTRKLSGLARYTWGAPTSQFSILGLAYHNRWNASDQIPLRAVQDGLISRFGNLDSTDGGATQRYSLSGSYRHIGSRSTQIVEAFAIYSDLALFSNFTYFLENPAQGDQFSQTDHRAILGANVRDAREVDALGASHTITLGVQTRADIINGVGLFQTKDRVRYSTIRRDDVRETGSGVYISVESPWSDGLRTMVGGRADAYTFAVSSSNSENSGYRTAGIVSPKASVAYAPSASSEIYLSGGFGFHSNDARGTTITIDPVTRDRVSRVSPLVRSRGAELGWRTSIANDLRTTLSAWALDLDSELLFTGDAGITEPAAASRRRGVTLANFYRPLSRVSIDADVSLAHAKFVGVDSAATHVPGALENVVSSGITLSPGKEGIFSSIRLRHFGSYPLNEQNSLRASASNLVNAEVGYQFRSRVQFQVSVLNLLNQAANDVQYAYASRLRGETSDGVDDVHFHPAEPRQVRALVTYRF